MIWNQFKIEIKRHGLLFVSLAVVNIILFGLTWLDHMEFINEFVIPVYGLIGWMIILILLFMDIFNELNLGKNRLILMLPIRTSYIWYIKYVAVVLGSFLFWGSSLFSSFFHQDGIYLLNESVGINGSFYFIISRMMGILSGFSIVFCGISLTRRFKSKSLAILVSLGYFIVVTTGLIILILALSGALSGEYLWGIGLNSGVTVLNQYGGFIPVMIIPHELLYNVTDTVAWGNVLLNFIVLIVQLGIIFFVTNYIKSDYQ